MAKIIQHQIFYPNPAADVWAYLTDLELMKLWLMPSDFKPVLGHKFRFTSKPMPDFDFDGIFHCEVLELVPFKKLSYSWDFGPGTGFLNRSEVHWTLTEKDNGTHLLLIHRGAEGSEMLQIFDAMDKGWLGNINKIAKLLNPETDGTAKA
ncbi:SRPBCC domain-containing protein [Mucilaginibacter sp. AW1-3]